MTILLDGGDTGNACTVIETLTPAGAGPPPHLHHREDERFLLLSGEITIYLDGEAHALNPGDYMLCPCGIRITSRTRERPTPLSS